MASRFKEDDLGIISFADGSPSMLTPDNTGGTEPVQPAATPRAQSRVKPTGTYRDFVPKMSTLDKAGMFAMAFTDAMRGPRFQTDPVGRIIDRRQEIAGMELEARQRSDTLGLLSEGFDPESDADVTGLMEKYSYAKPELFAKVLQSRYEMDESRSIDAAKSLQDLYKRFQQREDDYGKMRGVWFSIPPEDQRLFSIHSPYWWGAADQRQNPKTGEVEFRIPQNPTAEPSTEERLKEDYVRAATEEKEAQVATQMRGMFADDPTYTEVPQPGGVFDPQAERGLGGMHAASMLGEAAIPGLAEAAVAADKEFAGGLLEDIRSFGKTEPTEKSLERIAAESEARTTGRLVAEARQEAGKSGIEARDEEWNRAAKEFDRHLKNFQFPFLSKTVEFDSALDFATQIYVDMVKGQPDADGTPAVGDGLFMQSAARADLLWSMLHTKLPARGMGPEGEITKQEFLAMVEREGRKRIFSEANKLLSPNQVKSGGRPGVYEGD